MRGIFLFELALLTPMVIMAAVSLVDITEHLRTKNALKEASQAAIRCLTTEGSACTTTAERPALSRLYSYYRQTTPPPLFGNLRQVPVKINERMSPLQRYQFDATVLDSVYTGAEQRQYEEVALTHNVAKVVPYILQEFPYYVRPTTPGSYDIFAQAAGGQKTEPARTDEDFSKAVTDTEGISVGFSIPKPSTLKGFGAGDICSRSIITNGGAQPEECLLRQSETTLFSSMMIVLEGNASRGNSTTSETAELKISASYSIDGTATTIDLGGQKFSLNGKTRAENFLPRGAPIDQVDESLNSKEEFIKHGAAKVILPFGTRIKVRVKFKSQPKDPNASWTPQRLRVFIPSFKEETTELTCSDNLNCRALSSGSVLQCKTSPNLNPPGATLKLGESTPVSATPPNLSKCLPNAESLSSSPKFKIYTINNKSCADNKLVPVTTSACPALITKHSCNSSNKGVANPPSGAGIISGSVNDLSSACKATTTAQNVSLPAGTTLKAGEALATTKTVRVMNSSGVSAESKLWQQSCDLDAEKRRVVPPAEVGAYPRTAPVRVGTVDGQLQSLPVQSAATTQESLSCLPVRELSPSLHANIYSTLLGDYSYLLSPHTDKGCAYPGLLSGAKQQVEKDPRYQATVGGPVVAGRFEIPAGSKPDACTPFTVGTSAVKKESLRLIGTFPETAPPAECSDGNCIRELVGFSGGSSSSEPPVNIQQAISEAEAAALAYLPKRSREELTITVTPPSRSTIGPKTYQVTTSMKVPLSFGRKSSAVTHVAHGQAEG